MRKISMIGLLVLSLAIFATCKKSETPDTQKPTPEPPKPTSIVINSFSPQSVKAGDEIEINGSGFGDNIEVITVEFYDGLKVKPKSVTPTKLYVIVPTNAKSGIISVKVGTNNAINSSSTLTVTEAPNLTITNFTPATARVGEAVSINGLGFGTDINVLTVQFGDGATTKPKTATNTQLVVDIPANAKTGKITIKLASLSATSGDTFTLNETALLSVSSFSPNTAKVGEQLTIVGTGFGNDPNAVLVQFGNGGSVKPKAVSPNQIVVDVPSTASTGQLTVSLSSSTSAKSLNTFTVTPTIITQTIDIIGEGGVALLDDDHNPAYRTTFSTVCQTLSIGIRGSGDDTFVSELVNEEKGTIIFTKSEGVVDAVFSNVLTTNIENDPVTPNEIANNVYFKVVRTSADGKKITTFRYFIRNQFGRRNQISLISTKDFNEVVDAKYLDAKLKTTNLKYLLITKDCKEFP